MKHFLLVLAVNLILFLPAKANISQLYSPPGQITAEPQLGRHFTVESEELFIDLRDAIHSGPAKISAVYHFSCDTDAAKITLVFVANNLLRNNYRILLDGHTVPGDTISLDSIPPSWRVPELIELPEKSFAVHYQGDSYSYYNEYISFSVPVNSGQHELKVDYEAELREEYYAGATISHNLLYMLSPARDWKSYGGLQLKLAVPEEWALNANLKLQQENGFYTAKWNQLPADYFFVETHVQAENGYLIEDRFLWTGWILSAVLIVFFLLRISRNFVRGKRKAGYTWSAAIWLGAIWLVLFAAIYFARVPFLKLIYGEQLSPQIGHGDFYIVLGLPFLWLFAVIGLYLIQLVGYFIMQYQQSKRV